jgi:hypothetical protein
MAMLSIGKPEEPSGSVSASTGCANTSEAATSESRASSCPSGSSTLISSGLETSESSLAFLFLIVDPSKRPGSLLPSSVSAWDSARSSTLALEDAGVAFAVLLPMPEHRGVSVVLISGVQGLAVDRHVQ